MEWGIAMVTKTDIIIIAIVLGILGLDALLFVLSGEDATISWRVAYWSKRQPIVALLFGILMGHLFWKNLAYCQ